MATVTLAEVWLHEATDNTVSISGHLTGEAETTDKPGGVARYANGRLRTITGAGSTLTLGLSMDLADRADIDQLRTWVEAGTLLLLREPRGRLTWGSVFDLSVDEVAGAEDDVANLSFTFRQVSYSEVV